MTPESQGPRTGQKLRNQEGLRFALRQAPSGGGSGAYRTLGGHVNRIAGLIVSGITIGFLAGTAVSAQPPGNPDGRGNGPSNTPPGQERRTESVPEPATLTLLALGAGGGLLARRWLSRDKARR